MKKIILDVSSVIGTNNTTGIQRVTIELSKRFISNYKECLLIAYNLSDKNFYYVDKSSFYSECYSHERTKKIIITKTKFKIGELDDSYSLVDIDSVHDVLCCQRSVFYKKLKEKKVEIISLVHDLLPIMSPQFWPQSYDKLFLLYIASIFQYSDKIITTTEVTKKIIEKFLFECNSKKKVFVAPLGCNLKKNYSSQKISKNVITSSNNKFILMVATFEPRKNHLLLVKAFKKIAKKTNLSLIFAGRLGWNYNRVIKEIKKSNLFGKRLFVFNNASNDDIVYLYKKAFAFIFPSFNEGYGLPIVEAMYYGCPVLVSDIPVFREIAKDMAIYFKNDSSEELSNEIIKLYNDKKRYLCFKNKLDEFKINSWDDSFDKIIGIINH